mgnify:CR=1 FL=1
MSPAFHWRFVVDGTALAYATCIFSPDSLNRSSTFSTAFMLICIHPSHSRLCQLPWRQLPAISIASRSSQVQQQQLCHHCQSFNFNKKYIATLMEFHIMGRSSRQQPDFLLAPSCLLRSILCLAFNCVYGSVAVKAFLLLPLCWWNKDNHKPITIQRQEAFAGICCRPTLWGRKRHPFHFLIRRSKIDRF